MMEFGSGKPSKMNSWMKGIAWRKHSKSLGTQARCQSTCHLGNGGFPASITEFLAEGIFTCKHDIKLSRKTSGTKCKTLEGIRRIIYFFLADFGFWNLSSQARSGKLSSSICRGNSGWKRLMVSPNCPSEFDPATHTFPVESKKIL